MPKTRDNYQVQANSLPELILGLNLLLQRLADRMDKMEGIRGTAEIESNLDMNSNQIVELQASTDTTDAVQQAELPNQGTSTTDSPTFLELTVTQNSLFSGDITVSGIASFANITTVNIASTGSYKYTDSAGTVLHSFATTT